MTALLAQLQHPMRLPILLELEREELHAAELAARLGVSFDTVNYAVGELMRAGYVELVRTEPAGSRRNTLRRVYRAVPGDWQHLVEVLDSYARDEPAGEPAPGEQSGT